MISSCRPLGPFLYGLCLVSHLCTCAFGRDLLLSPSSSPSQSQELVLLEFSQGFTNFQEVLKANRLKGWGQNASGVCTGASQAVTSSVAECNPQNQVYRSADFNSWTGVTCNPGGEVVCVNLPDFSLRGAASGISLLQSLPSLGYLNLGGNRLFGTLPSDLGWSLHSLQSLHLEDNDINSTLAPQWGSGGSWAQLQQLYLQGNHIYGTLPAAWGFEGNWDSLQTLNLSNNRLQGSIPESYSANNSGWLSLESAYLRPGNSFCGPIPWGFPALTATGTFVTGPTSSILSDLNVTCSLDNSLIPAGYPADNHMDGLSHGAVAGIITGEVLVGTFLLLCSGLIHRRYRWRHERSWVLFDWDVVAESPPKPFINFGARFGWGSKNNSTNGNLGGEGNGFFANGLHSPFKLSSNGAEVGAADVPPMAAPVLPGVQREEKRLSQGSFSDVIWQDLLPPEEVVIQQNADGSLRQLGNGSFGKVYKAVLQDVHEVAVKVFEGYAGQREQDLLLKEISILRSCRNKNIVQFFGVTIHDDDIWMMMELMDGNLFRHLARGHHCTWYFRGRSIALDIARGMHFLHSRRIIHMDLKSPNILLSSTGTAKIADVGLARVMGSESIANQVVTGTMHWMAPEVLINGRCTEKADIFSFGVILWEICTAEAPTRGRMSGVRVPDECPAEVAQLMESCMEEDPEKRPSALDIIHRIQVVPVTSRPLPQAPWYAR